ncbi:MAG: YcjX family protein [Pseudomonadaceae bacterium]|nr:MAG: YcjX family protein [Pseudomonadaceae bacterium]
MATINNPTRLLASARHQVGSMLQRPLRIGVTGLSQAGKTTFITSLLNQLENHQKSLLRQRKPFDRLLSVHWQREGTEHAFPYLSAMQALSGEPARWPESTSDLTRVELELRYAPGGLLGPVQGERLQRVELIDYPGEWLLDLPLLQLDYGQWCEQMARWLQTEPRASLIGDLAARLQAIDPQAAADSVDLHALRAEWTGFLQRCREAGLARNQPGRFLLPGRGIAEAMLDFVPLLAGNQHSHAASGSVWADCQARFNYYRDFIVKGFYDQHFSRLDQQVLLVDMLGPLAAGPEALADVQGALDDLLGSFRYGRGSFFERLFKPRIRRLALCATKVDQLTAEQQRDAQQCLEDLLTDSLTAVRHGGVTIQGFPLAAVRATQQEGDTLIAGRREDQRMLRYRPAEIPAHLPLDLQVEPITLPPLRPPPGLHRNEVFPNYRMDQLVAWLLGEKR